MPETALQHENNQLMAERIACICQEHDLKVIVTIDLESNAELILSPHKIITGIDIGLIRAYQKQKDPFHFGTRTIINIKHISIMILNMPVDNPALCANITESIKRQVDKAVLDMMHTGIHCCPT